MQGRGGRGDDGMKKACAAPERKHTPDIVSDSDTGLPAGAFVAVTAGTSSAVSTVTVASTASASVTAVEPGLALVLHPALGSGQKRPAGQPHLTGLLVDLEELDIHLVTDLKHVLNLVHFLVVQLGDMQQAFLAGQYL